VRLPGTLFVVATPIGNLDDISSRARAALQSVSVIAAEDTRQTRHLLDHLGVATPMVSLHEHNEQQRSRELLGRLTAGDSVALVSDAGTPLISDPGFRLVAGARERGIPVTAVPGCCAAIAALSIAGLPVGRFHFEGFLPSHAGPRRARLQELKTHAETVVFYEAVHRVRRTLDDLRDAFGGRRPAFVARELTKLHETAYHGSLDDVRAALAADPGGDRGEFTLVVAGAPGASAAQTELERVVRILAAELPAGQAATLAARLTGAPRRETYRMVLNGLPGGRT
jgi:16S rRNA (cytidine1402-2'-O)-methyltransferase